MQKVKQVSIYVLACLLGIGFFLYLLFMPIKLVIKVLPDVLYLDESLTVDDIEVYYKSLLGFRIKVHDFYYKQSDDVLYAAVNHLNTERALDSQVPDGHDFIYDTKVYAGQAIDKDKLHVQCIYGDTVRETKDFYISSDIVPMGKKVNCQILLNSGIVEWSTDVVLPNKVKAKYKKVPKLGDLFDKSQVVVRLQYPDGTSIKLDDFTIEEPPVYLTGKLKLSITTDYGDTTLQINPENYQALTGEYHDTVYVGDTLDDSKFTLNMADANGNPVPIDDFTVDNPGQIKTMTDVTLHSKFGDAIVTVDPVRVESCMGESETELVEGSVPVFKTIHLYYTDGQVRDLSPDDVEFTNLDTINRAGLNTVYFIYNGVYYWFEKHLMPEAIVSLRKSDVDLPDSVMTYELSDVQLDALAIIAQNFVGDDLTAASTELSLMANRYELYASNGSNDGTYLMKYITESGYWGNDIGDYLYDQKPTSDMLYLTQDILMNGHRSLPLYIDERVDVLDIQDMNSSEYEKDQTVITKQDDTEFRFFMFASESTQIVYGYTDFGYESIKQTSVPASHPKTKIMDIEEDDGIIIQMMDEMDD